MSKLFPRCEYPVFVSYGGGLDSSAMLVKMWLTGQIPTAILFADTGGEKMETYAFIHTMDLWLTEHGMPGVTWVTKPGEAVRGSKHKTLEENCIENETLPSLAFGYKSCSLKWKAAPMDHWVSKHPEAQKAWDEGRKVTRAIGYDASPADMRRSKIKESDKYTYWYPLREAGIRRPECAIIVRKAGLPVPMKSSCFFCPAMKRHEVKWLAENHPNLLARGLKMERGAREGKHGLRSTKGLGRSWSWEQFVNEEMGDTEPLFCDMGAEE